MFKTLTESIQKERPEVQARIVENGGKLAAKRDAADSKYRRLWLIVKWRTKLEN